MKAPQRCDYCQGMFPAEDVRPAASGVLVCSTCSARMRSRSDQASIWPDVKRAHDAD